MSRTVVIGVGNALRGDDVAGLCVARLLSRLLHLPGMSVHESPGDATAIMALWQGADTVVLADAAQSGAPPGTVERFDASSQALPTAFFHFSTHAFGLAEAVELARALGTLPSRVTVYGIEGASFEHGEAPGPEVETGIHKAVERIVAELTGNSPAEAGATSGRPCTNSL